MMCTNKSTKSKIEQALCQEIFYMKPSEKYTLDMNETKKSGETIFIPETMLVNLASNKKSQNISSTWIDLSQHCISYYEKTLMAFLSGSRNFFLCTNEIK